MSSSFGSSGRAKMFSLRLVEMSRCLVHLMGRNACFGYSV